MNRLIQITDLHFGENPSAIIESINPVKSFSAILDEIENSDFRDAPILLSGDLSGCDNAGSYQMLNKMLFNRKKEIIWLPGNHDDLQAMNTHLTHYPRLSSLRLNNWSLITLNSSKAKSAVGFIDHHELLKLDFELSKVRSQFVIVAMHHCPASVGSDWLDRHRIENRNELFGVLSKYDNVVCILNGHVHQKFEGVWKGIPVYASPSSCFQFKYKSKEFAISKKPPGYRWLHLFDNGTLETGVKYLA